MNLGDYGTMLRRWGWLIAVVASVVALTVLAVSLLTPSTYEATVTLRINPTASTNTDELIYADTRQVDTYAELMCTRAVLEDVIYNLRLATTVEELSPCTGAAAIRDTQLIVLAVHDPDPMQAVAVVNEIAEVFIEQQIVLQMSRYEASEASLESEVVAIQETIYRTQSEINALGTSTAMADVAERDRLRELLTEYQSSYADLIVSLDEVRQAQASVFGLITITEPAQEARPTSPGTWRNVLLGTVAGALLGLGIALLFEYCLGRTMETKAQVEALIGTPTLGVIAHIDGKDPLDALVTTVRPRSPITEAYRVLRGNIVYARGDRPTHTILITSAEPLEGKSITAANLAIAAAQAGKRAILVDGNLRRPVLHKLFQQHNERGLSTMLMGKNENRVSDYLVSTGLPNLLLLPSGPLPPNPITLLESPQLMQIIEDLTSQGDVAFIDSPSLLPTHMLDAALLASRCDATLLVVLATSTRANKLIRAKERLQQAGANLLGVVLNGAEIV